MEKCHENAAHYSLSWTWLFEIFNVTFLQAKRWFLFQEFTLVRYRFVRFNDDKFKRSLISDHFWKTSERLSLWKSYCDPLEKFRPGIKCSAFAKRRPFQFTFGFKTVYCLLTNCLYPSICWNIFINYILSKGHTTTKNSRIYSDLCATSTDVNKPLSLKGKMLQRTTIHQYSEI